MKKLPAVFLTAWMCGCLTFAAAPARAGYDLFARSNLVAWCIVPFDAKKRGPEERAAMLEQLGFKQFAYDWRAEQIPTFEAELDALKRHGIELTAWWFPGALNKDAQTILSVLERHKLKTQLWTVMGDPAPNSQDPARKVGLCAERLRPIAAAAARIGCTVELYNHGGWFGEPENQLAIIERLRAAGVSNIGIVYNLHHGHEHLARFPELLKKMLPYLHALNLNGMTRDGEKTGRKILPLGQGELDLQLLKTIRDSGYRGPIGILNHTGEDAEARLRDNLDGLDWLVAQLDGAPPGPKPKWRTGHGQANPPPAGHPSLAPAFGKALRGGLAVDGRPEYREQPITVECRAKLDGARGFNLLVACDPKSSAEHWELYSYAGSGVFSVYQPGRGGEFKSDAAICDSRWHYLAAILEPARVRLFVDGKLALDKSAKPLKGTPRPGGLAFGRLAEGGVGCNGMVDDVRLSKGVREIAGVPAEPSTKDAQTIGLWTFDDLPAGPQVRK